ncbi:MAG: aminotransferase class I/II-fold pyridoxal phosphate-dependent enzyme [Rickettsiales bacterium]|nr:aminotransferase class I/II-fold pyridoxal phosphate-dependent enzyme [Rickettsiales bacterium]
MKDRAITIFPLAESDQCTKKQLVDRHLETWRRFRDLKHSVDICGESKDDEQQSPLDELTSFLRAEEDGLKKIDAIDTCVADPLLPIPDFVIESSNEAQRRNPELVSRYDSEEGYSFVRKALVPYVTTLLPDQTVVTEKNIMLTSGINSVLASIYDILAKTEEGSAQKKVAVLTNEFFYSIPNPLNIDFHAISFDPNSTESQIIPAILETKITELKEKGYDHIVFYYSNPDNPMGHVVGEEKIRELTEFFKREKYDDVTVINDLAYNGTQFDQTKEIKAIYGEDFNSVILFGLSKLGAPGRRAAAVVTSDKMMDELSKAQFERNIMPGIDGQLCMYFFFHEKNTEQRKEFLSEVASQYHYNSKLLKCLINGYDEEMEITEVEKEKMMNQIKSCLGVDDEKAVKLMREGIDGVSVVNNPEASFFSVIDFHGLHSRSNEGKIFKTGIDVAEAMFEKEKLFMLPLDLMMLGNDSSKLERSCLAMRFGHAVEPEQIIKSCFKIDRAMESLMKNPRVAIEPNNGEAMKGEGIII